MADKYDSNGDYKNYSGSNSSDFKRKNLTAENSSGKNQEETHEDDENGEQNPAAQKAAEYIRELLAEKIAIDHGKCAHAARLLDQELQKVQTLGKAPPRENKYVDIYREKPIKVSVKVLVPVREHPRFNFVGKLLGPKGNSMKRLQEETMCKMAVLGRGSMKDRAKEEELRNSLDPKYGHLSDDLHVEISALGPPAEAHARVAYALAEVRKYLIPDNNDNIRQEQMREMEIISTIDPTTGEEIETAHPRGIKRSAPPSGTIIRAHSSAGFPRVARPATAGIRTVPVAAVPSRSATAIPPPAGTRGVMPAKTKILSILDRARVAMEESYGAVYDDPAYEAPPHHGVHERSYVEYVAPSSHAYSSSHHYDEYDTEYYPSSSRHHEAADPYEAEPSSRSWKSNYKPSSSSSSRHHESSRYRTSPYTRPSK
ncbi:KH domain-containing, RNA-binding, signal transduction-associated protein 2-like isoform X3 [Chrysoperla carnea]|uniref:KH domain-containing, RNA-binding, signal transduction-associated protein 2-like isoform X3 n=1 Tax=Chrysoperla carnea TaxID=189513 RepID=UPI001D05FD5A|nr:KH domain-containing, RNA-binding, signal transduction-associated protein 2-like isoform X3 [Chrysoperla carnea]